MSYQAAISPPEQPSGTHAPGTPAEAGARQGDASLAAVVTVDRSGTVTFANEAFRALVGAATLDGLIGAPLDRIRPPVNPPGPEDEPGSAAAVPDGRTGPHRPLAWCRAAPDLWIGTAVLAGRACAAEVPPADPVRRDELTGLADRASLRGVFRALLDRGGDAGGGIVTACVDLDRFKSVNDSLGHAVGDELLRKVAKRLTASVRRSDTVIRMGGDEFTVLFADCGKGQAEDMARRIIDVLSRPFLVSGHQVIIGASVGLADLLPSETDPSEMMRRADVALYRSKAAGRGCLHWFEDGMFAALDERRLLGTDLRKALLLDQFELAYQSQFDFETDTITGFEALLRWKHLDRGTVSPADFIPIAEETGEMLKIGRWVLHEACRAAMSWPGSLTIAVNVSPMQFEADGFLESVMSALDASGLPPHRLELELTETVLVRDEETVVERMRALRTLGVRLSLDDFGTGYSSLNYLRKYPFTKVKIDQSFVREPHADETAHRIVTAVAGLGAAMGLSVIAEGVETEAQLTRIRLQGCSAAQGFLLSRPIAGQDVAAYLNALSTQGDQAGGIMDTRRIPA